MARKTTDKRGRTVYATAAWVPGDVLSLRPGWTDEQAEEWLEDNAKHIEEAMVRAGWEAMEALLPVDEDDDDDDEDEEDE